MRKKTEQLSLFGKKDDNYSESAGDFSMEGEKTLYEKIINEKGCEVHKIS